MKKVAQERKWQNQDETANIVDALNAVDMQVRYCKATHLSIQNTAASFRHGGAGYV
ncbi:MAG: hypothetical protein PUJ09_08350 [Eubacteriales bacterium]|nr:hypothetical protein [Eubacteriales bacterium]